MKGDREGKGRTRYDRGTCRGNKVTVIKRLCLFEETFQPEKVRDLREEEEEPELEADSNIWKGNMQRKLHQ